MANEGLATMLRVQQYVNAYGNAKPVAVQQPIWDGDTHHSSIGSGIGPVENEEEDSSPMHKFTSNGQLADDTHASQGSLETAAAANTTTTAATDVPELPIDECWLFKCPKRSHPSPAPASHEPIQNWLRAVFDAPNSMFYSARRNLLTRLEIILAAGGPIDAYRFGGSVPSLNQLGSGPQQTAAPYAKPNVMMMDPSRRIVSAGSSDSLSVNTSTGAYMNGTSGTFGKLTKPKYSLPPQYSTASGSQRMDSLTNLSTGTPNLSQSLGGQLSAWLTGSPGKSGSLDELEKGASRTNIQEIARIQEDNLKADVAAMAAAAAASGRHGSQHSLASLGRRSPDGTTYSRVPSAPESPHASNPQLAHTGGQPVISHVHRPTVDLSSASFASYMVPESVRSQAQTGSTIQPSQPYAPRVSQTGDPRVNHNGAGQPTNGLTIRHAYSPLPQKPTIPVAATTTYHRTSTENIPAGSSVNSASYLPQPNTAISIEPRNQFGFRSMRRIPGPQSGPRPAASLPPAPRRFPPGSGGAPITDGSG